jgi:hypothetical protein
VSAEEKPIEFTQQDSDYAEIILKAINAIPNKTCGAVTLAVAWLFEQDPDLQNAVEFIGRNGWVVKD